MSSESITPSLLNFFRGPTSFFSEEKKELTLEEMLKEIDSCSFGISAKQFAHRMVPAYLDKTEIVGISSMHSVNHWIDLIEVWLESKALFLPHSISISHLHHLLTVLKDYQKMLQQDARLTVDNCQKLAQITLEEIKTKLSKQKIVYVPLGYRDGPHNGGHAITFKIWDRGRNIEAVFLNLGEGVQMHPQVGMTLSGPRFHFQSFPVLIAKSALDSPLGEECFTRLARLKIAPCPGEVKGYAAEDIYGPIYSLGTIQSTFNDALEKRSCKPQLGDICGDMAIVLLIKDVLIDLRYDKEQIHRFFSLEKFCNILFFYSQLTQDEKTVDEWVLLQNGLKEFSIRILKDDEKGRSAELKFINRILDPLFTHVERHIQNKIKKSIPLDILMEPMVAEALSFKCEKRPVKQSSIKFQSPAQQIPDGYSIPQSHSLNPKKIKENLREWVALSRKLQAACQTKKAHQFVYRLFYSLDIPHPTQKGFWDEVPEEDLSEVIELLTKLAYLGVQVDTPDYDSATLIYTYAMILSSGYAITDRLIRRKYPLQFDQFASPFFPSSLQLVYTSNLGNLIGRAELEQKNDFFEFWMLPTASMNRQWVQIREYFEQQQKKSLFTLFALEKESINIARAVDDFQHIGVSFSRTWSPEAQHLKFLEQFLDRDSPLSYRKQYENLWLNKDHCLSQEIESLYFFAYYSWFTFSRRQVVGAQKGDALPQAPRPIISNQDKDALPLEFHSDHYLGCCFHKGDQFWKAPFKMTENESQCFQLSDKSSFSPPWNLKISREWKRIFSNTSLQISSAILWIDNNITLLSNFALQKRVEVALFMPGLLHEKIRQEPSTLYQLRKLIKKGIEYYRNQANGIEGLLFFVRLGICIESYVPQQSKKTLQFYENILLDKITVKSSIGLHQLLLFLYQIDLPRYLDSLKEA